MQRLAEQAPVLLREPWELKLNRGAGSSPVCGCSGLCHNAWALHSIQRPAPVLALLAAFGLVAPPAVAEGFAFFDQGAKATGLAGAFAAQADDASALFYNPGGLALLKKKKAGALGLTVSKRNESLYQGLAPGVGAGTAAEQETPFELPAHLYGVLPLGERGVVGVGIYSPFLLSTEWQGEATFAGRFLATGAEITTYDVNPTVAFALTPNLGIGLGATYRTAEVATDRRYAALNPFNGRLVDAASVHQKTDMEAGFGWNVGLLHKVSPRFSYGLAYRSKMSIDLPGVGRMTQISTGNQQLDDLFAATLPLDRDLALETRLELPDVATLGIAIGLSKSITLELDVNRTGWKTFRELAFTYSGAPILDQTFTQSFEDSLSYRAGLLIKRPTGPQFRFGGAFEESPQPDFTVGPLLPDSNRTVLAAGFGVDWLDVAFAWTTYDQRIVRTNIDGINGNWRASSWMVAITLKK